MGVVWSVMIFFLMDDVGTLRDIPQDFPEVLGDLEDEAIKASAVLLLEVFNPTVGWRACLASEHCMEGSVLCR